MRIVLPLSRVDLRLAVSMLEWVKELSGNTGMDWIVACEESLDRGEVMELAYDVSKSVSWMKVTSPKDEWPSAANAYFADVARAMNGERWYFFEADNTPVKPLWAMLLEAEAMKTPDKCVGAIHSFGEGMNGQHLAGTAIYPPLLWDRCPVLRSVREMTEAMCRQGKKPRAFDTYLQGELLPISVNTPLICHQWRASNYRRENGRIRADVHPGFGLPEFVNEDAVVVHGAKDGSLIRLLRSENQAIHDTKIP